MMIILILSREDKQSKHAKARRVYYFVRWEWSMHCSRWISSPTRNEWNSFNGRLCYLDISSYHKKVICKMRVLEVHLFCSVYRKKQNNFDSTKGSFFKLHKFGSQFWWFSDMVLIVRSEDVFAKTYITCKTCYWWYHWNGSFWTNGFSTSFIKSKTYKNQITYFDIKDKHNLI